MHGVDRGLELVGPRLVQGEALPDQLVSLVDHRCVPQRAVLLVESDQHSLAHAGRSARVDQQHQRQQPVDLRLAAERRGRGEHLPQLAGQPDRLGGQIGAQRLAGGAEVALVEDQVEHGEHRGHPLRNVLRTRDAVGDVRRLDLLLGAGDPLGHRRLGDEEGGGDLGHGEATEQPERESHAVLRSEGGVAAGEHQPQPVVLDGAGRFGRRVVVHAGHLRVLLLAPLLATDPVERLVAGHRGQPAARVGRQALDGPALGGDDQRLAGGVLGQVEVTETTGQAGHHTAVLGAEDGRELCSRVVSRAARRRGVAHSDWNGRTSTAPMHAADPFLAISRAASRSGASTTQKPPSCSLVSA